MSMDELSPYLRERGQTGWLFLDELIIIKQENNLTFNIIFGFTSNNKLVEYEAMNFYLAKAFVNTKF